MILNSFINGDTSSSSGAGIIIEVGDTLPDTGIESQLFVIPKTNVNTLYVSYDAPSSPQEGDIWVEFKSTTESSVWFISEEEPYLIFGLMGATQYVDSTWVDVEGYYYKNSEWSSINGAISSLEYTGSHLISEYTSSDGTAYTLYTLTGTGALTAKRAVTADIWACGGGANGASTAPNAYTCSSGGAGAYCAESTGQLLEGTYVIAVAAESGSTYIEDSMNTRILQANGANGVSGGTGGGGGGSGAPQGNGDGIAKYPFGDSTFFKRHCAGGGGGAYYEGGTRYNGGAGGSNGGNGNVGGWGISVGTTGGAGGNYGGGKGGNATSSAASAAAGSATFYGSGGGGRSRYKGSDANLAGTTGSGYQGVIYIRIPK